MMPKLLKGDCLLYKPVGIFGWLIHVKTWHPISHVEVYDGEGKSWASRDGKGVNLYPLRETELYGVYRPVREVDMEAARAYGHSMIGTPYGWADLVAFLGVNKDFKGIVCSPFACEFYRKGGLDLFPGEDSNDIAPFEFAINPLLTKID